MIAYFARELNHAQTQYLYSLPLIIHVPSAHFFVAHAGLLPYDPRYSPRNKRQPLAHSPRDISSMPPDEDDEAAQYILGRSNDEPMLRFAQEKAILHDVPANHDAWAVLNMRGVTKKGKITRSALTIFEMEELC